MRRSASTWYLEIDPTKKPGERGTAALYPTPGLTLLAQLSANEVRGLYALSDDSALIAVSGATVYSVTPSWVATVIGTLTTTAGPVSIADNGTSAYLADGVNRYYYTWATSTFATVASTDGPFTGADQVGIIDNYLIYTDPARTNGAARTLPPSCPTLSISERRTHRPIT
jgi:hypothetical protein